MRARSIGTLAFMTGGLLVWAAQFTLVYAFAATVCARGLPGTSVLGLPLLPFGVALVTVMAIGATLLLLARAFRRSRARVEVARFVGSMAAWIAALSLIAVIFTGLPLLLVDICA
jgi:hypothetical protein